MLHWIELPILSQPLDGRDFLADRVHGQHHAAIDAAAIDEIWRDDAPGEAEHDAALDLSAERLRALQATFEASEWGDRKPIAVELELHLPIDAHVFVCKLDAVYEVPADSELAARGIRHQVVDWKTGKAPRDARDLELKQTQLALYRLAYAKWADVPPDTVDAVFYFVEDDRVIRPDRLYDEAALRRSWASVAGDPAADPVVSEASPADSSSRLAG